MRGMDRRSWLLDSSWIFLTCAGGCNRESAARAAPAESVVPSSTDPIVRAPSDAREAHARSEPVDSAPTVPGQTHEPSVPKRLPPIYIQPLGPRLPTEDVQFVVAALGVFFPHPVVELDPIELPRAAYYSPRARYRAEKILEHLESLTPGDAQVVLGLTDVDISTTKPPHEDWGILGLAAVGGKQCVISRFRAKRGARDPLHTRIRLAKTMVHEVGHTLGLLHCPNYGCLMEDGKGSVKTTDHEYDLCDNCRSEVASDLRPRNEDAIPWRRPT